MEVIRGVIKRYSRNAMNLNILIFLFVGGWPLQKDERNRFLHFIRFLPYFAIFGNTIQIINSIYDIPLKIDDYSLLAEAVIVLILSIRAMIRLAFIIFRVKTLEKMFHDLNDLSLKTDDEEEMAIFKRYNRKAQLFTICYSVLCVCLGSVFSLESLLENVRTLPGHTKMPFKQIYDSPIYEILFTLFTMVGFEIGFAIALGDAFLYSLMMFVTAHYKILQHKVELAREYAKIEVEKMKGRAIVPTFSKKSSENADRVVNESKTGNTTRKYNHVLKWSTLMSKISDEELKEGKVDVEQWGFNRCSDEGNRNYGIFRKSSFLESKDIRIRFEMDDDEHEVEYSGFSYAEVEGEGEIERFRRMRGASWNLASGGRNMSGNLASGGQKMEREPRERRSRVDQQDLDEAMKRYLADCVKSHQALISFTDLIQDQFNYVLFFEFCINSLMVAIDLFQVASVPQATKFCIWVSLLFTHVVQIFAYCWSASEVEKESANLSDAVYFGDWFEAPASYKRSMLIIMSRSVQPVQLRAASFLTFNMETFSNIMNSAYSYYGILQSVNGLD